MAVNEADKQKAADVVRQIHELGYLDEEWIIDQHALAGGDKLHAMSAAKQQITNIVAEAIAAERERCAKIADAMRPTGGRMWTDEQHACYEALSSCAAAIREGKE